jgi:hypothetical protein
MHKLIVVLVFVCMASYAQFGVSVRINAPMPPLPPMPPTGFVVMPTDDDDMNRPDLVVVSPTQMGFWVPTPSGRILRCRTMRYDGGEWYYGPWHNDNNMTFNRYQHSSFYNMHFNNYMQERYPKYYDRRFKHREEWKEDKRYDRHDDRDKSNNRNDYDRHNDRDKGNNRHHDKHDNR